MTRDVELSISEPWMVGWFLTSVAGLYLLAKYVGKPRRAVPVRLSEEGVSYSLSFVLVVPIIMFFCVLVVETVFIQMARIGVSYAAYAGNRSAVVWMSAKPEAVRKERITQAVLTALAPFTWNRADIREPPTSLAFKTAPIFAASYKMLTREADENRTVTATDAAKRYLYASGKMGFSVRDDKGVSIFKLEYRYRCLFGFAGRILDKDHRSPYQIVMTAENKLPSERPGRLDQALGIDYHSEPTSSSPRPRIEQIDTADTAQN